MIFLKFSHHYEENEGSRSKRFASAIFSTTRGVSSLVTRSPNSKNEMKLHFGNKKKLTFLFFSRFALTLFQKNEVRWHLGIKNELVHFVLLSVCANFVPKFKKITTMKKIITLFILLFISTFECFAQNYQEVVYLNDGSIFRGIILEQVPNDFLKIETSNGKIYFIDMEDVEKITKERARTNSQVNTINAQADNRNTQSYRNTQSTARRQNNTYNYQGLRGTSSQRQNYYVDDYYDDGRYYSYFPNTGYKGFIELGYSFGTNSSVKYNNQKINFGGVHRLEFSTSHGVIISPYAFIGLGAGIHFYTGYSDDDGYYQSFDEIDLAIPIFAHVRTHFLDKKVSPFVDVKLGYSVHEITGTYFSPSVGCRFSKGSRSAFWISMGYTLQQSSEKNDYYGYKVSTNFDAFSIKLGWDF